MNIANTGIDSSLLISNFDLVKPIWGAKLYDPYGGVDKSMLLMMQRSSETVGGLTGYHYEQERDTTHFLTSGVATVAGAQNIQTVTLSATLVNADGTSAVRVGDHLTYFPTTGGIEAIRLQVDSVSGANPPVCTLRPLSTGFATALPSGTVLQYAGRSEKERSGNPGQLVRGQVAYNWYTQITREEWSMSDIAETLELKPAVMADGTALNGYKTIATRDCEARILRGMSADLWFGRRTDPAQANLNISKSTIDGIDVTIAERGWKQVIGNAAYTYANLQSAASLIKAQGQTEFYNLYTTDKRRREIDAFMETRYAGSMSNTLDQTVASMLYGGGENHSVLNSTFNWKAIDTAGIKFVISELPFLNNPTTYNVGGTGAAQNLMYFLPMGKEKITMASGETISSEYMTILNRNKYANRWMVAVPGGMMSSARNTRIAESYLDLYVNWGTRYTQFNRAGKVI
jgi:hypothetical protein